MIRIPSLSLGLVLGVASLTGSALASVIALGSGFERATFTGVAGGTVRAIRFGNTADGFCKGWIGTTPNHVLSLEDPAPRMVMRVRAPSDTTLVVLGPGGTRCNDDVGEGFDPELRGDWQAGEYRVFVGTYDEGQSIRYTLELVE